MSSDDWDPAVGLVEDQREGKSGCGDIAKVLFLFVCMFAGSGLLLFFSYNSYYNPEKDKKTASLERLIQNVGSKIKTRNDCEKGVQGYYAWDNTSDIDEVTICKNNFLGNEPTSSEYWRLLAHEATHIMQACLGTNLYGSYQIKDMSYELLAKDEISYRVIHGSYVKRDEDSEIEARWMELQPKQYVIDELRKHCMERPQDRRF